MVFLLSLFVAGVGSVTLGRGTAESVHSPGQVGYGLRPLLHHSVRHGGDQQQRNLHAAHAYPVQPGQYSLTLFLSTVNTTITLLWATKTPGRSKKVHMLSTSSFKSASGVVFKSTNS